jgi:glycosyltransferase involved in cell wall biosynthesis
VTVLSFADTRFPIERANGIQTLATCQALAARGHDVTLVVRPDTGERARDPFEFYGVPRTAGLRLRTIPGAPGRLAHRLRFLLGAIGLVRRTGAVIYTRDLGLASLLAGRRALTRAPLVYESHGLASVMSDELPQLLGEPRLAPSAAKLRRLEARERRVWTHADAYVTITQALASELRNRYGPRDRLFVVPDGASLRTASAGERPESPARPLAAYAGHLYPWKGVDVFVRALALAPGIHGLIVGGHPGEADVVRIAALARDLGVADRLEITGLVPPADVSHRLAPATILVLPNTPSATSDRYTSPLKLFEYLQLGRPIVASDLTAIREVLTDGETALLVPAGDAAALAAAFQRLTDDPGLADRLAQAARRLADRYTWAARAAKLEAAFAAALS